MSPLIDRVRQMRERFYTRIFARIDVVLTVDGEAEATISRNLSPGGMCVVSERAVSQGKEVTVELTHGGTAVSCRASVASVSDGELGLQFIEPSEQFIVCVGAIIREVREQERGHDHVRVAAAWSHPTEGKISDFWRAKRNPANLFSLTVEGAALVSPKQPEVGEIVVIYLTRADTDFQCQAEVVRQTARGFAVRFLSPDSDFSELIANLRHTEGRPEPV